jgi:hypothetical protein
VSDQETARQKRERRRAKRMADPRETVLPDFIPGGWNARDWSGDAGADPVINLRRVMETTYVQNVVLLPDSHF